MEVTNEERLQAYKRDLSKELSKYAEYEKKCHEQFKQLYELSCSDDRDEQIYADNQLVDLTEEMHEMAYQHQRAVRNYRHEIWRLERDL